MTDFNAEAGSGLVLEFDDWSDLYNQMGASSLPSELHGVLAGSLCTGLRLTPVEWLQLVADHVGMSVFDEDRREERRQFENLYSEWEQIFKRHILTFSPLLPDDDLPLSERLEAMGAWCHGFIEGFSRGVAKPRPEISAESREILNDLMAIGEIDPAVEESDEQERYYVDLVEFVRVATMNLFEEFNQPKAPPPGTSLH